MKNFFSRTPLSIIFLDGDKIVEHYGMGDERNVGECSITFSSDLSKSGGLYFMSNVKSKTLLSYNGEEFEVKYTFEFREGIQYVYLERI